MKLKSKKVKNKHYFIIYDSNDEMLYYFDNWKEFYNKHLLNYELRKLVYEFNHRNSNIITVIINHKKCKLATYC